ncbi:MAG TPA: PAS domain S-box protein [Candidatus Binataceae bacterium]|nr:PAS domain S-box protein [Candidatus Binataceae bacterium]
MAKHRNSADLTAFRAVVDRSPNAIVVVKRSGTIAYANQLAVDYFGYSREELIEMSVHRLVPDASREAHAKLLDGYMREPRQRAMGAGMELHARRKDGSTFPIEIGLSPIMTSAGFRVLAVINDITRHKQAEENQRRAQERFRSLLESSPLALILVDDSGKIAYANARTSAYFGYTIEELAGIDINLLVPAGNRSQHRQLIRGYMDDPSVRPMGAGLDITAQRKDGSTFPAEIGLSLVDTDEGRLVLATIDDITQRKEMSQALLQRTRELERSNTELEQFAYVASHDLQEPLRMVVSFLQLLSRRYQGQISEEADEFINFAVDGANRMKRLIGDLLDFSRAGRKRASGAVALEAIVEQVREHLALRIAETGAIITCGELPMVQGDEVGLYQVLLNLVGNALKFRGSKRPEIHVSAEPAGQQWTIAVADNGIGIAPEHHERIFLMFQRLHGRDEYDGTGIGLSICKRIVERYGGRMWLESHAGSGSTFYFTLPAVVPDAINARSH